jgi:hypothetical protein
MSPDIVVVKFLQNFSTVVKNKVIMVIYLMSKLGIIFEAASAPYGFARNLQFFTPGLTG